MERVENAPGTIGRTAGLAVEGSPVRVKALTLAPLLLRLTLGSIFFAHGAQKLLGVFGGGGLMGTAQGFEAMGLKPALFLAVAAALLEFGGALLLFVGLFTRAVAALLLFEMLFALFAVHLPNGFFLAPPGAPGRGHGIEFTLALSGALAALTLLGPGRLSLEGSRAVRSKLKLPDLKPRSGS